MNTQVNRYFILLVLVLVSASVMGCTYDPATGQQRVNKTAVGAGVGAVGGALVGSQIGGGDWRKRALLGAGIGALAGGAVGYYMDRQEAKLRQDTAGTGVEVHRQGDDILLNMPGNVTFDVDSSRIKPQFYSTLDAIANTLAQNPKTYVDVMGHTDSTGSYSYNQQLSERRAQAVASHLVSRGVMRERILTQGYGETRPVADNNSSYGRSQNRRVEIRLSPVT